MKEPNKENHEVNSHKHILKLRHGITIEATVDEDMGTFTCQWSPSLPYKRKIFKKAFPFYEKWRNRILTDWACKHNKRILVVCKKSNGKMKITALGPPKE